MDAIGAVGGAGSTARVDLEVGRELEEVRGLRGGAEEGDGAAELEGEVWEAEGGVGQHGSSEGRCDG